MKRAATRHEQLNHDLVGYSPKAWGLNIPFVDYTVRLGDLVPATAGTIGKIALVAAFAVAWAKGFGINDPAFVTENVRLEIMVASILTLIFCALLNPYAAPPGTLAPLIPLVPAMVLAGVHPLPLGILIGGIGIAISAFRYFDRILEISGKGAKGGIILLFGFLGIHNSLNHLKVWADANEVAGLLAILIVAGAVVYLVVNRIKAGWLTIPICAGSALLISVLFGIVPEFNTPVAFPVINPDVWWNEKWGLGYGISIGNFIKALPFALLAVVMWPTDALAMRTLQEVKYPKEAQNALFRMDATFIVVSIRNIIGVVLGGAQTAAIWRSFMVPLGTVKRPIGGSALLLGIAGTLFGISGWLIDIAVFPPLVWLVLIFGVYVPFLEVGLKTLKTPGAGQVAVLCIVVGVALSPVLGWAAAIFTENFNLLKGEDDSHKVSKGTRTITVVVVVVTVVSFLLASITG